MKYPKIEKDGYWEYEDGGYYYYIQWGPNREYDYHITPEGVSVDDKDGSTVTNITPISLFGETEALTENQLMKILNTPIEGVRYTKEDMKKMYEKYLDNM